MLIKIPFAPSTVASSSRGLEIAFCAASMALVSPVAMPLPISALPMLPMMHFTSAKSRLMSPGMTIKSEILQTACLRISSTIENALGKDVCFPT